MKINKEGLNLIKEFEGFRSKPYSCSAGVSTVGYGSTRYADGKKVSLKDPPISEPEALKLLFLTLLAFETAVNVEVDVTLTENQFSALVCLVYNIGVGNFAKSTLLKKLNYSDFIGAAQEFPRWDKANGQPLSGLTKRRKAEQALFLKHA